MVMKTTPRSLLSILLTALALPGAALGASLLSQSDCQPSIGAGATVAQSTTAILEDRAA
jgi:hypothetical protein